MAPVNVSPTRPELRPGPASYPSASSRAHSPYSQPGSSSNVPLLPSHHDTSGPGAGSPFRQNFPTDEPILPGNTPVLTPIFEFNKNRYATLDFWPPILKWYSTLFLVILYFGTAGAIVALWLAAGTNGKYHLSSENVHMISRYFPSGLGTVNVILFRHLIREFIRMKPFVEMADQPGEPSLGQRPSKTVSGAFFPWQDFSVTRGITSTISLFCQFMVGFIVSLKVALLASGPAQNESAGWTLTVRVWPAFFLIIGHIIMAIYVLWVAYLTNGKSTGLRWDPVTIADYAALFSQCNVAEYFSELELLHNRSAKHVLATKHMFRLGYWKHVAAPGEPERTVYGIGTTYSRPEPATTPYNPSLYERLRGRENAPSPVDDCAKYRPSDTNDSTLPCKQGTWPGCEHYPYRHSPGCGKGWIVFAWLLVVGALALAIFGLANGIVFKGFHLRKDWSIPGNMTITAGAHTVKLPPIDPTDPESQLVAYALAFRSVPVYVAGLFTGTIVEWVDLNMRFMQLFINMFGKPGNAADTILLAYITTSPLQVPITAIDKQHYRVAMFSTLNTLSPLFPIFIGGLLTLSDDRKNNRVIFNFSLSAYIGIMVFLSAWSIAMLFAYPFQKRLLPRQFYSMADLMAMCHKSTFLQRSYLDFADRTRTPSKDIMDARILYAGDSFMFGHYTDDEDRKHIGFDVHSTKNYDTGRTEETHMVHAVTPSGELKMIGQTVRSMTNLFVDAGRSQSGNSKGLMMWLRRFRRKHRKSQPETELEYMRPVGSATGSHLEGQQEVRQRPPVSFAPLTELAT